MERSVRIGRLSPRRLSIDPLHDVRRAAVLFGTARSGTTKVAELLTLARGTRLIYEPLHSRKEPGIPGDFVWGRYYPPEDPAPEMLDFWRETLTGRRRTQLTSRGNTARIARRRLVKTIAGTNLVDWLRANFPEVPVVYLVRHPFAVATSMCDLYERRGRPTDPESWGWQLHGMVDDLVERGRLLDGPLADLHDDVVDLVRRTGDPFGRAVIRWCLENRLALEDRRDDVPVVFFERLFDDPEAALPPLARHLDLPLADAVWENIERPSASSEETGLASQTWASRLAPARVRAGLEILAVFGLDRFYGAEQFPLVDETSDFLRDRRQPPGA